MPISTKGYWLKEDRIIYAFATGLITYEEIKEHETHLTPMLDGATFPVDMIFDMDATAKMDLSLKLLKDSTGFGGHPNVRWIVSVVKNPLLLFLGSALSQFRGRQHRFRTFATREDALEFLKEMDSSLNDVVLPPIK